MRHSKCIAAQPPSNAKLAERACDTKLKKMGLSAGTEDPHASKKQQLLAYEWDHQAKAADALADQPKGA
jgi:hypothetical protein